MGWEEHESANICLLGQMEIRAPSRVCVLVGGERAGDIPVSKPSKRVPQNDGG